MRLPLQVQAILFKKSNGKIQYLVVKRIPEKGGFWQPITGGLEEGETKIEALKREVREETGIKNPIRIVEGVHYCEFRWCGFQEALNLLKWKENKEALTRLNKILSSLK